MAGVHIVKLIGACVRWFFFGFKRKLWVIIDNEEDYKFASNNFLVGMVAMIIIFYLVINIFPPNFN